MTPTYEVAQRPDGSFGIKCPDGQVLGAVWTKAEAEFGVDVAIWMQEGLIGDLLDGHQEILEWAKAYPLSVFPEPDLKRAAQVLRAAGMTLDAISASSMRHVITRVAEISCAAIAKATGHLPGTTQEAAE